MKNNSSTRKSIEKAINLYHWNAEFSPESLSPRLTTYNAVRRQYHASKFTGMLAIEDDDMSVKILGITSFDLFVPGSNFVFGLADPVQGVAILSIKRLLTVGKEEKMIRLTMARIYKEVAHKIGHLFQLTRCLDWKCIMSFANGIWDVDAKLPRLCPSCRRQLQQLMENRVRIR